MLTKLKELFFGKPTAEATAPYKVETPSTPYNVPEPAATTPIPLVVEAKVASVKPKAPVKPKQPAKPKAPAKPKQPSKPKAPAKPKQPATSNTSAGKSVQ